MNLTENFVDYLKQKETQITDVVLKKAQECVIDYIGVTIAGAKCNEKKWKHFIEKLPEGSANVFGYHNKTDARTASLINGINAHTMELDDGHRFAMIHFGASIISAVLAAADERRIGLNDIFKGIVMGYEAACRVSVAMQPVHKQKGYHTAGTCGTIGTTIAVCTALRHSKTQMIRALTCSIASAAGMLEIQEQDSELKPYNLGRAAMDGLTAAYMGETSFGIPEDMLGGERGFFHIFSDDIFSEEKILAEQNYFEIERIYVKPYASCRHCHSAIEAALSLRKQVDINSIEKINVYTYKLAVKGHDHTEIRGVASAKLSIPYSVAVSLVTGKADLSVYEEEILTEKELLKLVKKISILEKEEYTKFSPQKRIAELEIITEKGKRFVEKIDYAKGDPENAMSSEDIFEKSVQLLRWADHYDTGYKLFEKYSLLSNR